MGENRSSYGNIFKAIALFGGVKVIQIIISMLRSKAVALLLGPGGMGISNMLKYTVDTVSSITGCGLQFSAVRDVAKAYDGKDQARVNKTITTLRRLVWLTGIAGSLIVFFFAEPLSLFAFSNKEYVSAFRILSIVMLFMQLNIGQIVLLQGTFHYKDMAKATVVGQFLSLLLILPLYYFLREDGIVPALILSSAIILVVTFVYSRRVAYRKVVLGIKEFWAHSKGMLFLGIVLAMGGSISNASSYLMNVILVKLDSIEAVGLYSAAISLSNSYVFLVLSSMTTDYVPRLSALVDDVPAQIAAINKQIVMVAIIISPLLIAFTVFAKPVIQLLYSSDFFATVHMIEFLMLGMFFRAVGWCLSYALVARGDSKIFLVTEITIFFVSLSLNTLFFWLGSFTGIGISIVFVYLIYFLMLFLIARKTYGFAFSREVKQMLVPYLCLCVIATMLSFFSGDTIVKYALGSVVLAYCLYRSIRDLDSRVHLKDAILSRLKK